MFEELLPHVCVVYRRSGEVDRFNQPVAPGNDEEAEASRFPCRVSNASGGEQNTERSHDVIITNHKVYASVDADVREDDVVTVLGVDGEEIVPRGNVTLKRHPYDMVAPHHVELTVTVQRQAR